MRSTIAATVLMLSLVMSSFAPAAPRTIDFAASDAPMAGMLVVPVGKGGALSATAQQADRSANGGITAAIRLAKFNGEAGQTLALYGVGPYPAVLLIGIGESVKSAVDMRSFGAIAAQSTAGWAEPVQVVLPPTNAIDTPAAQAALGARLGEYDFGRWTAAGAATKSSAPPPLVFLTPRAADEKKAFSRDGEAVAAGVWFARDLISTPSNVKTPVWFADEVLKKFKGLPKVTIKVLDERQIQALGMGALYGTGQGSTRPPRLVSIEYRGGRNDVAPIVFVGKGITFDTGGISIKPGEGMWRMRTDMSGAAAAAGALLTLAQRSAPVNAIAVLALAENMPDGNAIRPGDVLTSMSGKTIEVLNTDAEGRLVLADALWWAQQTYAPKLAVTIATLTGAVVRALGQDHAGIFTMDDALANQFIVAGDAAGEPLWRLPVTANTVRALKSDIADVRNVTEGGSAPGASVGAAFVMEWAKPETPFVHLDIAGTAWDAVGKPTDPKGAVGFGVRLFDEIVRRLEQDPQRL